MQPPQSSISDTIFQQYQQQRDSETGKRFSFLRGRSILVVKEGHCEIEHIGLLRKLFYHLFKPENARAKKVLKTLKDQFSKLESGQQKAIAKLPTVQRMVVIWKNVGGEGVLFAGVEAAQATQTAQAPEPAPEPGPLLTYLRANKKWMAGENGKYVAEDTSIVQKPVGEELLNLLLKTEQPEVLNWEDRTNLQWYALDLLRKDEGAWLKANAKKLSPAAWGVVAEMALFLDSKKIDKHFTLPDPLEEVGKTGLACRKAFVAALPEYKREREWYAAQPLTPGGIQLVQDRRYGKLAKCLGQHPKLFEKLVDGMDGATKITYYANVVGFGASFVDHNTLKALLEEECNRVAKALEGASKDKDREEILAHFFSLIDPVKPVGHERNIAHYITKPLFTEENRAALLALTEKRGEEKQALLDLWYVLDVAGLCHQPENTRVFRDLVEAFLSKGHWPRPREEVYNEALLPFFPHLFAETQRSWMGDEKRFKRLAGQKDYLLGAECTPEQKAAFLAAALGHTLLDTSLWRSESAPQWKDYDWLEGLGNEVWEAALKTVKKDLLDKVNMDEDPFASRHIPLFRAVLARPDVVSYSWDIGKKVIQAIMARFDGNKENPVAIFREIGADVLQNFPWDHQEWTKNRSNLHEQWADLVIPQLDMKNEKDVAILFAIAKSPLLGGNFKNDLIGILNKYPASKKKLQEDLNNVHEALHTPLWLGTADVTPDQLLQQLTGNQKNIRKEYAHMGYPQFVQVFKLADQEEQLPDFIEAIAKDTFRTPQGLVALNDPDLVLKYARYLDEEYFEWSLDKLFEAFGRKKGKPLVRVMEQLCAERGVRPKEKAIDCLKIMRDIRHRGRYFPWGPLAKKLDDPLLLKPLLDGPLGAYAIQIWTLEGSVSNIPYTDFMRAAEDEPWKLLLVIGDWNRFGDHALKEWFRDTENTSKPKNEDFPKVKAWKNWIVGNGNVDSLQMVNRAVKEAVEKHDYTAIPPLLEDNPKVKEILLAPITGPEGKTIANRINDFDEATLLVALSCEEGRKRLKPNVERLLHSTHLCGEFLQKIREDFSEDFEIGDIPHFVSSTEEQRQKVKKAIQSGDFGSVNKLPDVLFNNPESKPDLTVVVGERRIAVHKAILQAASPYFESMLGSQFREGEAAEYELKEVDPERAEAALRYLYDGVMPRFNSFTERGNFNYALAMFLPQ